MSQAAETIRHDMGPLTLLSVKAVSNRVSLSAATIYRKIKAGEFPAPRKDGMRSLWLSTDIDAYILAFVAQADAMAKHGAKHGTDSERNKKAA